MRLDPHQVEAVDWLLSHPRGGLADEMRVGKTAPTVVACNRAGAERVLVICPAHVRAVWREAWSVWGGEAELEIISYDSFGSNARKREQLVDWRPDTLILDECHYLKSKGAKRTRAVYGPGCHGSDLIERAERVWLLSGTPCPNGPHELWTHWHALFGEPLSYHDWIRRYCNITHTEFGVKVLGVRKVALPELQRKFRERFRRKRFRDVHGRGEAPLVWNVVPIEAPKLPHKAWAVTLTKQHKRLLAQITKTGEVPAEAEEVLATMRRLTVELKATLTVQHVREYLADPAKRVLVFGYHREALGRVAEDLTREGFPSVLVRGGMDDAVKEAARKGFNAGEYRVACLQIDAAGSGGDWSGADAVVFAETVWTPGNNVQAAMRSQHRDKKHPVPVDVLVLEGSIDEAVERVKVRKIRMMDQTYNEEG